MVKIGSLKIPSLEQKSSEIKNEPEAKADLNKTVELFKNELKKKIVKKGKTLSFQIDN